MDNEVRSMARGGGGDGSGSGGRVVGETRGA